MIASLSDAPCCEDCQWSTSDFGSSPPKSPPNVGWPSTKMADCYTVKAAAYGGGTATPEEYVKTAPKPMSASHSVLLVKNGEQSSS